MKEFLKNKTGLACVIAVAVVVLGGLIFGIYQVCYNAMHVFRDVTIELGTDSVDIADFLNNKSRASEARFVTDVSTVDIGNIGDTKITLALGDKEETVTLHVVDTTPPDVDFVSRLVETLEYTPKASDFVENVNDYSEITITFAEEPDLTESFEDVPVTVIVTDGSGNVTQQECTLCYRWILEEYTMELGYELTVEDLLADPGESTELIDQAAIDAINLEGAGEYTVVSVYENMQESCLVKVIDTTAPELELKGVSTYVGGAISLDSFVTYVNDASHEVDLRLATELPYDTAGKYTVTIEAEDPSGNVTSKSAVLEVKEDTDPPVFSGLTTLTVYVGRGEPDYVSGVTAEDEMDGTCKFTYDASGVDLKTAGTYYVTYTASDAAGNVVTANRKVVVTKDTKGPVFSGLDSITLYVGSKAPNYSTGVSAYDDIDGTCKFTYDDSDVNYDKTGTYYVIYTASDSAGNTTTSKRKVTIKNDSKGPVFDGLTTITLTVGDKAPNYKTDVTAEDDVDGTCKFTYDDSNVNYNKAGTYYVIYTASDSSGNTTTSKRKVVIKKDTTTSTSPSATTEDDDE